VYCLVLRCVAVCCSVLQCVAAEMVCWTSDFLYYDTKLNSTMRCVLSGVAVCCSVLQCVAMCCSVLHCVAVRRYTCKFSIPDTNRIWCVGCQMICHMSEMIWQIEICVV